MGATSKSCKACGAEASATRLDPFRGEEGAVAVTVTGMPALACPNGHKRFLYAEFVARLLDLAADPEKTAPQPPAVKRGLFKKHYHCSACDAELPAEPTGTMERELTASFRNADEFQVVVQLPLHKCPACGREQVLSNDDLSESTMKALTHGFRAADVHVDR